MERTRGRHSLCTGKAAESDNRIEHYSAACNRGAASMPSDDVPSIVSDERPKGPCAPRSSLVQQRATVGVHGHVTRLPPRGFEWGGHELIEGSDFFDAVALDLNDLDLRRAA